MRPTLSVVVPFLNEEDVLDTTCRRLQTVLKGTGMPWEIIFVDDGSTDSSASIIRARSQRDRRFRLLSFSRNFGQQSAVMAGLEYASGEAIVIIDADLQDPPEVIPQMIEKWREGFEVVYGRRLKRKKERFFKKMTSHCFYRMLNHLVDFPIPVDTGDFRLMDSKVRDVLCGLREHSLFLRGLISWIGFRQGEVTFIREGRYAGETKYPFAKMLRLSLDAVTSFSYKPLRLAGYLGFLLSAVSFVYILVVVIEKLFTDLTVPGWSSLMAITLFFNGITLIMLGILGEYVGRIYEETKDRPRYIITEHLGFDEEIPERTKENPSPRPRSGV
ncbi:MAG: glycosyltransferase family 2 protein [Synergistales bacterium]|nr:glycosyltransferase family 2 protein [Synergistales bacterium]